MDQSRFKLNRHFFMKIMMFCLLSELLAVYYYSNQTNYWTTSRYERSQNTSESNIEWIDFNPIYSNFNISTPKFRKRVTVIIIVSTAPRRSDRRQAIRDTWWQDCKQTKKVQAECIFMTDYQNTSSQHYSLIKDESEKFRDLRFQHLNGGIEFGIRFLYHTVYALKYYDFDYFLRMDDDYFFCLNNFLQELPQPIAPLFHWGWVHCITSIVRPEESMILFSRDLVLLFLSQNPLHIKCHPLADQMIGEWSNELNLTNVFRHDKRIHHIPIVSKEPSLRAVKNICSNYMSIHGCYPEDMRNFWQHKGPYIETNRTLVDNSNVCSSKEPFNWKVFVEAWKYEPKLCIIAPQWDTSKQSLTGGSYTGRQNV